ncbi:hypothetical protein ES708_25146 [subsurface metagenome]
MKLFKKISPSHKAIAIFIIVMLFLSFPLYIGRFYIFLIALALIMGLVGLVDKLPSFIGGLWN